MKELTIRKNDADQRLDRFVAKAVPLLPDSLLQKYIRIKRIKVNGKGAKRNDGLQQFDHDALDFAERFSQKTARRRIRQPLWRISRTVFAPPLQGSDSRSSARSVAAPAPRR